MLFTTAAGLILSPAAPCVAVVYTTAPVTFTGAACEAGDVAGAWAFALAPGDSMLVGGVCELLIDGVPVTFGGPADIDLDGAPGTPGDIAAFFACLADGCGSADFDGDGDAGTDLDVAAFVGVMGQ